MTTQHDYAKARQYIEKYFNWIEEPTGDHPLLTVLDALRLADTVQRGPTEGMLDAGESVVSEGTIDPTHVSDRVWREGLGWHDEPYDPGAGDILLQGRRSGSYRLFKAMMAKLLEEIEG